MNWQAILLYPFTLLYSGVVRLRNVFYDKGWLSSKTYEKPTICVGNLKVGGTGKTPHIEYLIRLLQQENISIATLSRGYGRKTKGFVLADATTDYQEIGDEPAQFKRKFGDAVTVAVEGDRRNGIAQLLASENPPEVILLDDAYQHRRVDASFNILLTKHGDLYSDDYVLPSGRLREPASGSKRADVIVVTKCPLALSEQEKASIRKKIEPKPEQLLCFSGFKYQAPTPMFGSAPSPQLNACTVLVITGIAYPEPLLNHLDQHHIKYQHLRFPDHHDFTPGDLQKIQKIFDSFAEAKKLVLTTEKDAVRLLAHKHHHLISDLPMYYLGIEVQFLGDDGAAFDEKILKHVRKDKSDR